MQIVTFYMNTGAMCSWMATQDCVLDAAYCYGSAMIVSGQPGLTYATWVTRIGSGVDEVIDEYVIWVGNLASGYPPVQNLNVEFTEGQKVFVNANGAPTFAQLIFKSSADILSLKV